MKPILFSTPMVRAILDNRKSMTRRVVKPQPVYRSDWGTMGYEWKDKAFVTSEFSSGILRFAPYQAGDILWVRETWQPEIEYGWKYNYKATYENLKCGKWRSAMFMPRIAARIWLRVTDVRCERVSDITEEDAIREGCRIGDQYLGKHSTPALSAKQSFMWLWNILNGKRGYIFSDTVWVWVIVFERIEKPMEEL